MTKKQFEEIRKVGNALSRRVSNRACDCGGNLCPGNYDKALVRRWVKAIRGA